MFLLKQICHSLAEAHARGMVHRDIKPANIFLCRMGLEFDFVKVLDFGLVQTRKADASTAVTETLATAQQLIGTPAYMAPEVILGRDDVDRRADVYAIGCVAFYLLTGTRVFQDGTQMQVADRSRAHRAGAAIDPVWAGPLPKELDRIGPRLPPQESGRSTAGCRRVARSRCRRERAGGHGRMGTRARGGRRGLPELAGPLVAH